MSSKKIGIFGAEQHGKTTLWKALTGSGDKLHLDLSWPNHSVDDEMLRKVLRSGGSIYLGCDHEITQEGRELSQQIARIESEMGCRFNESHYPPE